MKTSLIRKQVIRDFEIIFNASLKRENAEWKPYHEAWLKARLFIDSKYKRERAEIFRTRYYLLEEANKGHYYKAKFKPASSKNMV